MTLAMVALAVLAVVVFAFVLEPIVRARREHAVLDASALPEYDDILSDDPLPDQINEPTPSIDEDERLTRRGVSIDRPAGSDAS